MAIIKVNPDGSSNAKVGDWVVTGGGVFEKTATGSVQVKNAAGENILKDLIGASTTKSSAVVDAAYNLLTTGRTSGSKTTTPAPVYTAPAPVVVKPTVPASNVIDEVLNNTEVFDSATNYDSFTTPSYDLSSGASGTLNLSKIGGYAVVGLVLIVVLDKLIGGGR